MGRTQLSQGLAPPAIRKEQRAKHARQTINKTIPAILASNARARRGAEGSELIVDPMPAVSIPESTKGYNNNNASFPPSREPEPKYIKRKGQGRRKAKGTTTNSIDDENSSAASTHAKNIQATSDRMAGTSDSSWADSDTVITHHQPSTPTRSIRIIAADTLVAAHLLQTTAKTSRKEPNVCILNMASPLRPGGGVLAGATSQEESLCIKTTLLPSLHESFYRLPEYGGVFTRDVLVFGSQSAELAPAERYFVDAISAGMLRFPDLVGEEGEDKRLSSKDVLMVERKMRAVLRIACSRGAKKLVLGAWGCGAYGNPVRDIAEAWRRVLDGVKDGHGRKGNKSTGPVETWNSITDVVFAISSRKMAEAFRDAFDPHLDVESIHSGQQAEENDDSDPAADELRSKIQDMQAQLEKVWNPALKQRMGVILNELRAQLRERESHSTSLRSEDDDEDEDETSSYEGSASG